MSELVPNASIVLGAASNLYEPREWGGELGLEAL